MGRRGWRDATPAGADTSAVELPHFSGPDCGGIDARWRGATAEMREKMETLRHKHCQFTPRKRNQGRYATTAAVTARLSDYGVIPSPSAATLEPCGSVKRMM